MTRLMVWGASDDLIEVSEVRAPNRILPTREFDIFDTSEEAPVELHFSDGTVLAVWYGVSDLGIWRVEIKQQGSAAIVIVPAEDESRIYSDVAFVTGPDLAFVKCVCEGEEDRP